jgi:hypothetical protein
MPSFNKVRKYRTIYRQDESEALYVNKVDK